MNIPHAYSSDRTRTAMPCDDQQYKIMASFILTKYIHGSATATGSSLNPLTPPMVFNPSLVPHVHNIHFSSIRTSTRAEQPRTRQDGIKALAESPVPDPACTRCGFCPNNVHKIEYNCGISTNTVYIFPRISPL